MIESERRGEQGREGGREVEVEGEGEGEGEGEDSHLTSFIYHCTACCQRCWSPSFIESQIELQSINVGYAHPRIVWFYL